ncbi:PD40 domain-containing protein [candidate division KSB1 bacterium]|nr:PD40 domain-containing protein [candidate division KSB1 bacterium]
MVVARIRPNRQIILLISLSCMLAAAFFCQDATEPEQPEQSRTRREAIPADAVKIAPENDNYPPVLHHNDWQTPVPMPGLINTAGAEDSPFISPDGNAFFFFFTPDVDVPPNEQLLDGVTGIWWCHKSGGTWEEPQRIILNDDLSLDGAPFVLVDTLWFASVRVGNYGEIDVYTARWQNGKWTDWRNAGQQLNQQYSIGEFHLSADGRTLYFHWTGHGGYGDMDIWKTERADSGWSEPVNLGPNVNDEYWQGWPFVSQDGSELWFCGQSNLGHPGPSVYRSLKQADGTWGPADEIVSTFAGEPTLDDRGNLYFVHHFFSDQGQMIEADIYVAYRK